MIYISSITIKNFKCYKDVKFNFDPQFNLIIGGNNVGKSTLLESLRLWQFAFSKFLKDRTNQQSSSFYATQYFSFTLEELSFLRISNLRNLFYNRDKTKNIEITISISNSKETIDFPIIFTLTTEELNLRFELCTNTNIRATVSDNLLKILNKPKGTSFKNSFLITYISPIFLLPSKESFQAKGLIIDKLHQARADEVIRNLIHLYAPKDWQTKGKQKKSDILSNIESTLDYIIRGENIETNSPLYEFYSNFKQDEDSFIEIFAKNANGQKVELAQLGSGTINLLNILSILSYGDFSKYNLNVLLLDEPDSHLHSNHQKRLFEYLIKVSKDKNKQMFIITHNHELIDCADKVLYISDLKTKEIISLIPKDKYYNIYKEIAPDYHKKMLEISEKRTVESKLKVLTKPILICEGSTDITILQKAFKTLYGIPSFFNNELSIIDANGASLVASAIKSDFSDFIRIGLFDSDKAGIEQYKALIKNQKFIEDKDKTFLAQKGNKYILTLPIPNFRTDIADWYLENSCIEYMFSDETLEKFGIELENKKGNLYKTIKELNSAKTKIQKKLEFFTLQDFKPFAKLFIIISKIINFNLPNIKD